MKLVIAFGSSIRGDFDVSSDRDILVLSDSGSERESEERLLGKQGYSVSAFTLRGAHYMSERGNLFIKHVFDEGVLLSGSLSLYDGMRSAWRHAPSYDEDIEETVDISEVMMSAPRCCNSIPVLIDITATSLRNILIRKLAEKGIYAFSCKRVISESVRTGLLDERAKRPLEMCRYIKNSYRRGRSINISIRFLEEVEMLVAKIFKRKNLFCFTDLGKIKNAYESLQERSYKQLRSLELLEAGYSKGSLGTDVEGG